MERRSAARALARVAAWVGVGVLGPAACSFSSNGKGDTATTTYVADAAAVIGQEGGVATQTIGASGGSFVTADGVGLDVPAGALAGDTMISISAAASAPSLTGGAVIAGFAFVFAPEGLLFTKPVTLTLPIRTGILPAGTSAGDVKAMSTSKDGVFHPVNARPSDASHVKIKTRHFSTYVAVVPPGAATCPVCAAADGGAQGYDDCVGCNWGFHVTARNGQGSCAAGTPALGVHCEPSCGQAYQTGCDLGCGPGYHVTSAGISGQAGCEGFFNLTCSADVGDSYDTCDGACDTGYSSGGAGVASCMAEDTATRCTSQRKPAPACSGGPVTDAGVEAGSDASDTAPDAGH